MRIHREGRNTLILGASLLIAAILLSILLLLPVLATLLITLPFGILFGLFLWFFRVPSRPVVTDHTAIIAPADGKVVVIEKTMENEYFKDERIQISIFMSPLNVHQNVYPVSGEVTYTRYHKGKYLVAWHPKSSTENERSTVVIKRRDGTEILVRQIAGAVARRICTYASPGQIVEQGKEMGFIKFGSRVDVFLPADTDILCHVNDIAKNKITALARL